MYIYIYIYIIHVYMYSYGARDGGAAAGGEFFDRGTGGQASLQGLRAATCYVYA